MHPVTVIVIGALLAGCQTATPGRQPCGVIRDSLASVQATTPGGQQRLDIHYERGRAAGCWGR